MWAESRTEYVLRHFRFYYEVPEEVVISHGAKGDVSVYAGGKEFFKEGVSAPEKAILEDTLVLFPDPNQQLLIRKTEEGQVMVNADLIAAIFYLMSDWEGYKSTSDRLYVKEAFPHLEELLTIPLVDRWFDVLAKAVSMFTKAPVRRRDILGAPISVFLSHDIDNINTGRTVGTYNALKRGDVASAVGAALSRKDPWFNLDSIRELEQQEQVKSTFFFLTERGGHALGTNADYSIDNKAVRDELSRLRAGGWEVALHGSLGSHLDEDQFRSEANKLGEVLGNRFHYLNFRNQESLELIANSKLKYDASIGFPDHVGFRSGTSFPYKPYDISKEKMLEWIEIPLHVMDTSLQHQKYMNLKPEDAFEKVQPLLDEVGKQQGMVSLLWHNNYFSDLKFPGWGALYLRLIKELKHRNANFYKASDLAELYAEI